jgi:REP element-mobilizing transposase RayT
MRYWFLTSTFYGNWLAGDSRGFVSRVRDERPEDAPSESRHEHNQPDAPYDEDMPGLEHHSRDRLKCPPIQLNAEQAAVLLAQFQETARYRGWKLLAVAIMVNHVHLVVGVDGDPEPTKILGDFKAYGSRALNRRWSEPASGTWWTYDGSKRKLVDILAVRETLDYVVNRQSHPLVTWQAPETLELA